MRWLLIFLIFCIVWVGVLSTNADLSNLLAKALPKDVQEKLEATKKVYYTTPEKSKEAIVYLNSRIPNYIVWDEKCYKFAMFRAKDMVFRKYFDHKTPEGKMFNEFAPKFDLPSQGIGECIVIHIGVENKDLEKLSIETWIRSYDHAKILKSCNRGAIACYDNICVFIGRLV